MYYRGAGPKRFFHFACHSTRTAVLTLGCTAPGKLEDPKLMTQVRPMTSESLRAGRIFKESQDILLLCQGPLI